MRVRRARHGLFFKQFLTNYHTTGAILPSGPWLCAALARFVGDGPSGGRRILEVGPGTGSVTRRIARAMHGDDRLDLVELNTAFVECLRGQLQTDATLRPVAERTRVLHCPVQQLPRDETYDLIVSGLPLNNFSVSDVEEILGVLSALLKPGGTLTFFEYIAIRRVRSLVSGRAERGPSAGNRPGPRPPARRPRDPPRLDLAQRAAGLGASRAAVS